MLAAQSCAWTPRRGNMKIVKSWLRKIIVSNSCLALPVILPGSILVPLLHILDWMSPIRWTRVRPILLAMAGAKIGPGVRIAGRFFCSHPSSVEIRENVWISIGAQLLMAKGSSLVIDKFTRVGPEFLATSDTHSIGPAVERAGHAIKLSSRIGAGCWIGARCTLLPGKVIGDGTILAAGAMVASDIPSNAMFGGVPAEEIRKLS